MSRRIAAGAAGVLAAALLVLLGGDLMLTALERQLIYFPTRAAADRPTPRIRGAEAVDEVMLDTEDGLRIHGIYATRAGSVADLLFLHGNAGNLYDRLESVALLLDAGFNVLIVDYRGYGKSEGTPSEPGLYRDAAAAYRHMTDVRGIDPDRLVVLGRSLGSAVAIDLCASRNVGALIVEAAFSNARDMARVHYGWLPDVLLRAMSHEYDSLSKVRELRAPTLYVHGTADDIVPISMGRRLFQATPEPRDWYEIPGAGHNDMWLVGGQEHLQRLARFATRHVGD